MGRSLIKEDRVRPSRENDKKEVLVGIPFLSIPRADEDENPLAPGVLSMGPESVLNKRSVN